MAHGSNADPRAAQLSDELLAQIDARAAREGRSRSELIREALAGYLGADREAEIDRLIVEGYTRQPQTADELAFAGVATRTMLANVEPWEPASPPATAAPEDEAPGGTR